MDLKKEIQKIQINIQSKNIELAISQCNKLIKKYPNNSFVHNLGGLALQQFKKIKLSDYQINNVVAILPLREDINDMLIGVGFLKKFKEVLWSLNSNLMRFYK